ncbi:hypothetical protein ACF05W_03190 [Streptomyces lydicus]|uniref:hypothetical protein n=1 Tax=Streptomyces lydicus TaxID=47763 RepID=UPI00370203E2
MATRIAVERVGGRIQLNTFSFHRENIDHDRFKVSITDSSGSVAQEVRCWGNMISTLEAFATSIAHIGVWQCAKVSIYRTGYATVNGFNVRVTPLPAKG